MTNEQWNTTLYKQMFTEQEQFRDWLLAQPPEEILNHAYEYVMREDILLSLEHNDLTDAQAAALLASPAPLADVYKELDYVESSHMFPAAGAKARLARWAGRCDQPLRDL